MIYIDFSEDNPVRDLVPHLMQECSRLQILMHFDRGRCQVVKQFSDEDPDTQTDKIFSSKRNEL